MTEKLVLQCREIFFAETFGNINPLSGPIFKTIFRPHTGCDIKMKEKISSKMILYHNQTIKT